jgi:hypothetical protein
MERMRNAGSGPTESKQTFTSFAEITSSQLLEVELKQVISSLNAVYTKENDLAEIEHWLDQVSIKDREEQRIKIPAHLHHVLLGPSTAKAGETLSADKDKSHLCGDCGATVTSTGTGSLANTTNVKERTVVIEMA